MANMKQVLLKKKIDGVIYDLYVKTSAALVAYDDTTSVADKVAAVEAVADQAKKDLATLMGSDGSKSISAMIDEKVAALKTALTNESDATSLAGKIKANADAIAANKTAIEKEATDARAAEKTLTTNLAATDAKLATLIGDDANKSARTIAAEELAKQLIPEGADEKLDTLQEIAAWIQEHPADAAAMQKDISELKTKTGTIDDDSADLVAYIKAKVTAEQTRATTAENANKTAAATAQTAAEKAQTTAEAAQKAADEEKTRAQGEETSIKTSVTNLTNKVGTVPTTGTGANAATVVAYAKALYDAAAKAVSDEQSRAQGVETSLQTAVAARARFLVSATEPTDLTESDVWAQIIE